MLKYANRQYYLQLMRVDRPIGTLLLLWPTYWALWLSAGGVPSLTNLAIFTVGCFTMRAAGCVINDYADRDFDRHVKRTAERPLTQGRVSEREALHLFFLLVALSFALVLLTNRLTIMLSLFGVFIASFYPFAKRFTHLPQVVLGAAFSWSIPMAISAESNDLPTSTWLLYLANLLWVVAYDTFYAMVDRDDDVKIGIKSTAVLFGQHDRLATGLLQFGSLACLWLVGESYQLNWPYYLSLLIVAVQFIYHQYLIAGRDRDACFKAFLDNNRVGIVIFIGIVANYLV